jgi:hypothetical protein
MPDIHDIMDVSINDLSPEQEAQLKDVIDQFQQKGLMSFAKNRSGVPYLKLRCQGFCCQGNLILQLLKRNKRF